MGAGIDGHGLTMREQQIMDRHDEAGMSAASIAAELGLAERYVRLVIARCSGSWAESSAFERMVVAGTKLLEAACRNSGGRFS